MVAACCKSNEKGEGDTELLSSAKYPPESIIETTVLRDGRLHVIVRRKRRQKTD
jgi:hypothetical protein